MVLFKIHAIQHRYEAGSYAVASMALLFHASWGGFLQRRRMKYLSLVCHLLTVETIPYEKPLPSAGIIQGEFLQASRLASVASIFGDCLHGKSSQVALASSHKPHSALPSFIYLLPTHPGKYKLRLLTTISLHLTPNNLSPYQTLNPLCSSSKLSVEAIRLYPDTNFC